MKKLFIILLLLLTIFPFAIAYANMGPPQEVNPSNCGLVFSQNDQIKITDEQIVFDLTRESRQITAIYSMENTTNQTIKMLVAFPFPAYSKDSQTDIIIKFNGKNVDYKFKMYDVVNPFGEPIEYDQDYIDKMLEYVSSDEQKDNQSILNVGVAYYYLEFLPNEKSQVQVSYSTMPSAYMSKYSNAYRYQYIYFLSPAKYWKEYANLSIKVIANDNLQKYMISSNVLFDFDKENNVYTFTSDKLPESELNFSMYYHDKISRFEPMAFERAKMIVIMYLVYGWFIWVPLLIIIITIIVVVVVRKKKKKKQENVNKT